MVGEQRRRLRLELELQRVDAEGLGGAGESRRVGRKGAVPEFRALQRTEGRELLTDVRPTSGRGRSGAPAR